MYLDSPSPDILAMTTDINLERKDVDLDNCDREPIHIPNLIQPHGVLLAISTDEYLIVQVSLNSGQILGIEPQNLLDRPLREFQIKNHARIKRSHKKYRQTIYLVRVNVGFDFRLLSFLVL